MTPARTIFLGEKYDLGKTELPSSMVKLTLPKAAASLFWAAESILELPEPLWMRFLPKAALLSVVWRAGGILRGRRRQTVAYAIENNCLDDVLFGRHRPVRLVRRVAKAALRLYVSVSFDRIAFGSAGARETYATLRISDRVATRQWEELPSANGNRNVSSPGRAVFVGRLEPRKGLLELFDAWVEVEQSLPNAKLTVVGDGQLNKHAADWQQARPQSREWIGHVEHDVVSRLMAANDVLVAPSIRWGRWREQIGLPIGEGLSSGLTVVTTDETGLAEWLDANGHEVIPVDKLATLLGPTLVRALSTPLPVDSVTHSLPAIPGRLAADQWLHNPQASL